jgi:hypothetical protein
VLVVAAAVAMTIYFLLPEEADSRRVVEDVAALHSREPERGRPGFESLTLLRVQHDGVAFPAFVGRFGWNAIGRRDDVVHGRATTTVFYGRRGERLGYTVIAGRPLEPLPDARRSRVAGTRLRTIETDGRTVVVWVRRGHTCVMSAAGIPAANLQRLAAWKGNGTIPF